MLRTVALAASLLMVMCSVACDDNSPSPVSTSTAAPPSATATATEEPAIVIDRPFEGGLVRLPLEISGSANVFEAALQVEVIGPGGTELCRRNVQATSGSGQRGTWSAVMSFPPPTPAGATLRVKIRAFDLSARDGNIENEVTRLVSVASDAPAIVIASPACNAVARPGSLLAVEGEALVFEAVLLVELRDAGGQAYLTQRVMAANGTERSPWRATLDLGGLPAPGSYDLVAYSRSARDGAIINEFALPIFVGSIPE